MENMKNDSNVTMVEVVVADQTVEVEVKRHIPFNRQAGCARVIAEATMLNDGTFEPWNRLVYQAFTVLTEYANMAIPADWGNDKLMEFVNSEEYKKIYRVIDTQEFSHLCSMAEEIIEHRKRVCRRNGFIEFIDNVKDLLQMVTNAYQESPEAAEMLVTGLLTNIIGNDSDAESVENEVFTETDEATEDEVEVNADI